MGTCFPDNIEQTFLNSCTYLHTLIVTSEGDGCALDLPYNNIMPTWKGAQVDVTATVYIELRKLTLHLTRAHTHISNSLGMPQSLASTVQSIKPIIVQAPHSSMTVLYMKETGAALYSCQENKSQSCTRPAAGKACGLIKEHRPLSAYQSFFANLLLVSCCREY